MKPEDILADLEDVLRTMPARATLRHDTPENFAWLGRVSAALARWSPRGTVQAPLLVSQMQSPMAVDAQKGYLGLMILLHEARSDLRMTTLGPINTAIGHGLVFDYFDMVRKQIELAQKEILFVDPFLNAEFVSQYLIHAKSGVTIRLLAREYIKNLVPAAKLFAAQTGAQIEVRSASGVHDRYLFIDGLTCFQSGTSLRTVLGMRRQ